MKSITRLPRARHDGIIIRELDDETLVYDTEADKAHCLNRTASVVWKQCDGITTAREAAKSLSRVLGVSIGEDVIWLAVKQLRRFQLVELGAKSPSLSRRSLVLKYAPLALALPVIISINAPTPAQAVSCVCPACCPGFTCSGGVCRGN